MRFFVGALSGDFLIDDAYITLRYVQNVLEFGVLQYSVGESVFGIALIAINLRWAFLADGTILTRYTDRVAGYAALVETLKTDHGLTPDKSILTHEIGATGYFSNAIIYDAVGLTDPELAPLGLVEVNGRMGHGRCATKNIAKCNPDLIIFQDTFFEEGLLESESFQAKYTFLFEVEDTFIPDLTRNRLVYSIRP